MTEQDHQEILQLLLDLRKPDIQAFMRLKEIKGLSQKKIELADLIKEAIEDGVTTYPAVLRHIDKHAPWGKQHVYLLNGPRNGAKSWKDRDWIERHLTKHKKKTLLKRSKTLVLPEKLTLRYVNPRTSKLIITAVQKRRLRDRLHERDFKEPPDQQGQRVEFQAYLTRVTRLFVRFEWDLRTNVAMLQISQLQRGDDYSKVKESFTELLDPWLPLGDFTTVDLRKAIKKLQQRRQRGSKEIRIHSNVYVDADGRRVGGHSARAKARLMGKGWVDDVMREAAQKGTGHHGNYYWAPQSEFPDSGNNPLVKEVHAHLLAGDERINITRPQPKEAIRYVLGRIRAASG